ncbi:MAG TPA: alpha-ketoglutarate-dependent dioxygenase AlkB [Blastocatellia bacterium]|nr:alpha-ketoglutarate-dependent dioxygenase AlkB [Blastocatellia bacterium]
MEIYPGTIHLNGFLSIEEQRVLVERCIDIGSQPAGFYTPGVRGGAYMSIKMVCLGRHWNATTYEYESTRSDYDGLPVQKVPEDLKHLARRTASEAGMQIEPDICLLNFYTGAGKLGLHRDRDERQETIQAGIPVVSISLGDSAKFMIGGLIRKEPVKTIILQSGDAILFGGPSRLRFHGVSGILDGTAPKELGIQGRFNLTFRQY